MTSKKDLGVLQVLTATWGLGACAKQAQPANDPPATMSTEGAPFGAVTTDFDRMLAVGIGKS